MAECIRVKSSACADSIGARALPPRCEIMAIKGKVVERPVEDVSYVRATLRGMALTVKHLFDVNGRVTTQYPEEKSSSSPRWPATPPKATTGTGETGWV